MERERRGRRGGRDFGPRRFPPKPVEVGKEYDVEILETSRRGEGITRIKGLVVFIPNTKPGDKVRIRITRISRRFAEAEAVGEAEETPSEEETGLVEEETEAEETEAEETEAEETEAEETEAEETEAEETEAEETEAESD